MIATDRVIRSEERQKYSPPTVRARKEFVKASRVVL
jgi:hypothetical protein